MLGRIKKWKMEIAAVLLFFAFFGLAAIMITQMTPKEVRLVVDGQIKHHVTMSFTVNEFLQKEGIPLYTEDEISPEPDRVLRDGMEINLTKSVPFVLQADGETKKLRAVPQTIESALQYHQISLDEADIVRPLREQILTAGTEIIINRITFKTEVITEETKYKTKVRGVDSLPKGTKKEIRKGAKGQDEVTYRYTYSDGKLIKKTEIARKILQKPKNRIVAKSTRGLVAGAEYKKKFQVKAYSYSGGGRTAMGTRARVGAIAVDPRVIPLGTRVYVEGYGFARAEDTGGNIKGNTIDVYKNTASESSRWGVRYVTIYIL